MCLRVGGVEGEIRLVKQATALCPTPRSRLSVPYSLCMLSHLKMAWEGVVPEGSAWGRGECMLAKFEMLSNVQSMQVYM